MSVASTQTPFPRRHQAGRGLSKIFIEKSTAREIKAALGVGPREERAAQKAIRAVTAARSVASRDKPLARKPR